MMNITDENQKLLYQYEVMRARFDIREFFLETAVKDIYENIGQVLSLIKMQLAVLYPGKQNNQGSITKSGELLSQSIRDLRNLSRSFYPDMELLKKSDWIEALRHFVELMQLQADPLIKIKEEPEKMSAGLKVIVFNMILEILGLIKELKGKYKNITVSSHNTEVTISIEYLGDEITLGAEDENLEKVNYLSFNKRIQLINGSFMQKKNKAGITKITLISPLKNNLYE